MIIALFISNNEQEIHIKERVSKTMSYFFLSVSCFPKWMLYKIKVKHLPSIQIMFQQELIYFFPD